MRELRLEKDSTYRADGSSTVSHGNTLVMTSIYGPKQCSVSNVEYSELANITVKITYMEEKENNDLMNMNYVVQKLLENVIKRSLFPRSEICVYVQVVCDDGSLLSAILNSVALALDDSGLPITEKFASVCLMLSVDNEILPDPCLYEEQHSNNGVVTIVYSEKGDILTYFAFGDLEGDTLQKLTGTGRDLSKRIFYLLNHQLLSFRVYCHILL
ncbi:hypothetical protein WA577_001003, partial [Blastocystis sp. JDR]